ncbi:uncharacterized protein LOC778547 isoform X2 [Ciona intestinalis]
MENECVVVEPEGLPKDNFIGPEFSTFICSQTGSKKRTVNRGSSNHAAGTTEPSILDKVIRCTGCGEQILTHLSSNANEHPVLHVLLCKRCYSYYHSGTFQKDENGIDEFCRWCGDGGDVIMCDSCANVFCKTCIRRNFSRKKANEIFTSDKVQCFVCDLTPLQSLIQECKEVIEALNSSKAPVVVKKKHRRAPIEENKSNGVVPSPDAATTTTIKKVDHPVVGCHKTTDAVSISSIRSECITIVDDTCNKVGELHSMFKQVFNNDTEDQRKVALIKLRAINQIKSKLNNLVGLSCDFYESVCKEEKQLQARISHESTDDSMTTGKETDDLDSAHTTLSTPSRKKKLLKRKFRENILRNSNSPAGKTWRKLNMDESQEDKNNNEESDKEQSKYIPIKLKLDDQCSDKQALGGVSVSDIFHEEASDSDCSGLFKPRKIRRQSSNKSGDKSDSQKKESSVEKKKKGSKNDKEAEDQSPGAKTSSSDLDELIPKKKKEKKDASDSENSDSEKSTTEKKIDLKKEKPKNRKKNRPTLDFSSDSSQTEIDSNNMETFSDDQLDMTIEDQPPKVDPPPKEVSENDAARAGIQKIMEDEMSESSLDEDVKDLLDQKKDGDKKHETKKKDENNPLEAAKDQDEDDAKENASDDAQSGEDESTKKTKIKNALLREAISPTNESSVRSSAKRKLSDAGVKATPRSKKVRRSLICDEALIDSNLDDEDKQILLNKDANDDDLSDLSNILQSSDGDVTDVNEELQTDEKNASDCSHSTKLSTTSFEKLQVVVGKEEREKCEAALEEKGGGGSKEEKEKGEEEKSEEEKSENEKSDSEEKNEEKIEEKIEEKKEEKNEVKKEERANKIKEEVLKSDAEMECITIESDSHDENVGSKSKKVTSLSSDSDDDVGFKPKKKQKGQTWLDDFYKVEDVSDDGVKLTKKEAQTRSYNKVKKRRRIKDSGSEDSNKDSMDDFHDSGKKGRRNIRKILDNTNLSKMTQDAEKIEKARRKRLEQDQDLEEEVIIIDDEASPQKKKKVTTHLVLSKKPLVEVESAILRALKPHQVEGIKFLWRNVIESVARANKSRGDGCILAHCMGLGKTLQVVAFLHTVLHSPHLPKQRTALVVCPLGTVLNWAREFDMWTRPCKQSMDTYSIMDSKSLHDRSIILKRWHKKGGVLVTGYKMFMTMVTNTRKQYSRYNKTFIELMLDPGPDIVVCDEGHIIKNEATNLSNVMSRIKTRRRLVLTGTPLQNNLMEYYCMVNFIKPRLLGSAQEFNNRFTHPIRNGQHVDSTERDVKLMKKRSHVLHELLAGCVQRKDVNCLREQLMPKHEYVLFVRLTPVQIRLYEQYLSTFQCGDVGNRKGQLFQDFKNLLLIVCHPKALLLDKIRRENQQNAEEAREDIRSFLNDEDETSEEDLEGEEPPSDDISKISSMSVQDLKKLILSKGGSLQDCLEKKDLLQRAKDLLTTSTTDDPTKELWFEKVMPSDNLLYDSVEMSGKITLLMSILKSSTMMGDKVVLFSQSLLTLDLIEDILRYVTMHADDNTRSPTGVRIMKWYKDVDYYRMDGSTKNERRKMFIDQFNNESDTRCRLMLVSTRAGGIGINLVGANRAIVFDASWNPTHDVQSIFRIYRFGQTKPCYIYRFIAQGTMEEKIYDRQVVKQSLASRVVDEQQIERHYTANDIAELYTFKPERLTKETIKSRPTPIKPKDQLLSDILLDPKSRDLIVSYHEHDSLLGHQADEELSEADRRNAWDEYDRERFPPVPHDSPLLKLGVATIKQLIDIAEKELEKNTKQLDNCKPETLDQIMLKVKYLNRSLKIEHAEKCAHEIQLYKLSVRPQIERTRSYILRKLEQLRFCQQRVSKPGNINPRVPNQPNGLYNLPPYVPRPNPQSSTFRPPHPNFPRNFAQHQQFYGRNRIFFVYPFALTPKNSLFSFFQFFFHIFSVGPT